MHTQSPTCLRALKIVGIKAVDMISAKILRQVPRQFVLSSHIRVLPKNYGIIEKALSSASILCCVSPSAISAYKFGSAFVLVESAQLGRLVNRSDHLTYLFGGIFERNNAQREGSTVPWLYELLTHFALQPSW